MPAFGTLPLFSRGRSGDLLRILIRFRCSHGYQQETFPFCSCSSPWTLLSHSSHVHVRSDEHSLWHLRESFTPISCAFIVRVPSYMWYGCLSRSFTKTHISFSRKVILSAWPLCLRSVSLQSKEGHSTALCRDLTLLRETWWDVCANPK